MKVIVIFLILSSMCNSCQENEGENERSVIWARSSFTESDSIPWGPDSTFSNYNFHMVSFIQINENGSSILIKRNSFTSQRNIYNIHITDSLIKVIFDLIEDSTIINYIDPKESPPRVLYCGHTLTLSFIDKCDTIFMNYAPIYGEEKIYKLHALFEKILEHPEIITRGNIDTVKLDKILKSKIKNFCPPPPMRPSVEYIPTDIK